MREGDLCSIDSGDGSYGVVKILKLEDGIAHLRLYANSYEQRPTEVDPASLTLGTIHDESFGLGHMPLAEEEFLGPGGRRWSVTPSSSPTSWRVTRSGAGRPKRARPACGAA